MMKKTAGLDIGTNSIGWAVISTDESGKPCKIEGVGSRIIPMSQETLSNFDKGNTISPAAGRTAFRMARRMRERHLLRRERLHRVLNVLGFLPAHYAGQIDFEKRLGQFFEEKEPKVAWKKDENGKNEFIFQPSFHEMLNDFTQFHPLPDNKKIPYDWTIYYLRKKALRYKIEKEELVWILLNFNQKRGYHQLRGEDDDTDLNDDGTVKTDKEGNERRSSRSPSAKDWELLKKKTESDIDKSKKTVGAYIYETLLSKPSQKIRGKLVRTIERKFYKDELRQILEKQKEFHPELRDEKLFEACINELYPYNASHRSTLQHNDFVKLFLDDIIFYQRPLKSKKSLIGNCRYESRKFPVKSVAKSNPWFQEFRLWQFLHNLRIYEREKEVEGKLQTDVDVTSDFLPTIEKRVELFDWLNDRKEIKQDVLFTSYFKIRKKKEELKLPYRWNYVEAKGYPCNETRGQILTRLTKSGIDKGFLTRENEYALWHILYSVEDKTEIEKALKRFAQKHSLSDDFAGQFVKFPPFEKEYGSYSEKAIKKLLPLMRSGKYWNRERLCDDAVNRINSVIERLNCLKQNQIDIEEVSDEEIPKQVLKSFSRLSGQNNDFFSGLNTYQACYAVYGYHSESSEITRWKTPQDMDDYLKEFRHHSLRNPIVDQVTAETLRTVRDIWKKYGALSEIHLELGREMKNPADKRAEITKQVVENEKTNLRIKALLMELKNDGNIDNVRPYSPNQQELLRIYEEGVLNSVDNIDSDILEILKSAQPAKPELTRYKLWLEQKYRSPYTGKIIPLGKLFTSSYEIEHIIPQSRFFDDSLSNKVICETEVNRLKGNQLGYEFIRNHPGETVELNFGKTVKIFTIEGYEKFVRENYRKNRRKMSKLLWEDIPEDFIERQLNDSRYISKEVKKLLSSIVREENELEATSKNVIACTGGVTSRLKQEWGLNDVWNRIITPRFERMNQLTDSTHFGEWVNRDGKRFFQIGMPLELQRGFNRKRIDHRHHALDALIIACATRSHINYLNNESARKDAENTRYDLRKQLCFKTTPDEHGNNRWQFHKPWDTFTQDAQTVLDNMIVSFKQNRRIISKSVNYIQSYKKENDVLQTDKNGNPKKVKRKQIKGDNRAIRKPLHKETVFGKISLRKIKAVPFSEALKNWNLIVDKVLKKEIRQLIQRYGGTRHVENIDKYFKERKYQFRGLDISKVDVFYFETDNAATRKSLDTSFTEKIIKNAVADTGIQKILLNHLSAKDNEPALAFSPDGIEEMNNNIKQLNGGKPHQFIYKVRKYESLGNKFQTGKKGNRKDKYVTAEAGTNLYFEIYETDKKNQKGDVGDKGSITKRRSYETIPLKKAIERLKKRENVVPEINEEGHKLLFYLSPNDLVYIPAERDSENQSFDTNRIYKFIDSSGTTANFVPMSVASLIFNMNKGEQKKRNIDTGIQNKFGLGSAQSKHQKAITGEMIKEVCIKLETDRLGNIIKSYP